MKLNITLVAGGESHESTVALPGKDIPFHVITNAVMQAAGNQLNNLQPVADKTPFESITVAVVREGKADGAKKKA